ncbi:MAG: prenyltransferase [Acidimicrobiia bacterium]
MWLRDVPGVLSAAELGHTVDAIARWQLPDGMIPWFPGGHADPWNHTEAAMALAVGGRIDEAVRAFDWLAGRQRPDGAWHRYYVAGGVEEDKFDANCCAYPATGLWCLYTLTGDRRLLDRFWPMIDRALEFVLGLQTERGEVLWARHGDGTPWTFALLTGNASISHSLRCGLRLAAVVGEARPRWESGLRRLLQVIAHHPEAFAPKHRWAMDWYYPVLVGAVQGQDAAQRLTDGWDRFVMADLGVRCVVDQPWVTAAETCECALAHLAAGDTERALALYAWAQGHRHPDSGHYWTGLVHPGRITFPDGEHATYTAAAVVLTADALTGASPAAALFRPEPLTAAAGDEPIDDLELGSGEPAA